VALLVGHRTCDSQVACLSHSWAAPCSDVRQATYTSMPLSKQYKLVPARRQLCSAAGKVTVGLASHWPCVTGLVVYPPMGWWPKEGR